MKNILASHSMLDNLLEQEQTLQFTTFSNDDAHGIGERLYQLAKERKLPIVIDITRNGQCLYHAALEGSSVDNDHWIQRKSNVAARFSHSSHYINLYLKHLESTIEDTYLLDSCNYAAHGGSFPIILKGTGVIGTITVSGLPSEDDHALVIEVLNAWINEV